MTKAIKFNLIIDEKPIRTLDQLKDNFNLDDVIVSYQKGILTRWLDVRGYIEELKSINAIKTIDELEIGSELVRIFEQDIDEEKIKSSVYPIIFRNNTEKELDKFNKLKFKRDEVISDYHKGYEELCHNIESNSSNYGYLKASVEEMWNKYLAIFSIDFIHFFSEYSIKTPLFFFSMLANENFLSAGLLTESLKSKIYNLIPKNIIEGKKQKFQKDTNDIWEKVTEKKVIIKGIGDSSKHVKIKGKNGKEYVGDKSIGIIFDGLNFYSYNSSDYVEYAEVETQQIQSPYATYSGEPANHWRDIEPKGKKFLILKIGGTNLIRNFGKRDQELKAKDVNGKFIILDGIEYMNIIDDEELLYLEV